MVVGGDVESVIWLLLIDRTGYSQRAMMTCLSENRPVFKELDVTSVEHCSEAGVVWTTLDVTIACELNWLGKS